MVSFLNSTLAQVVGYVAAAVTTSVFRRVGAGWTARRLLKAGWSELARLGSGERVPSLPEFSARMVDRVGMLTSRLALAGKDQDLQAVDALRDLRIGLNMTLLQSVRARLGRGDAAVGPLMRQLSRHFASRPAVDTQCERSLLDTLDNALRAICAGERDVAQRSDARRSDARREALAALTGMRRDLFPKAAPYAPSLAPAL
jgi:uncharacterized membrane protein YccC